MKLTAYGIMSVLLTLTLFSLTSDAFGRRPSHSEVGQSQGRPGPLNENVQNHNDPNGRPAQSVPEPSTFVLVGAGLALIFIGAMKKRLLTAGDSQK